MAINTGSHPKLLWPNVYDTWGQIYDEYEPQYTQCWDIETSDQAFEEIVELTGFDIAQVKAEGAGGTYDYEVQGTIARAQHIAYSLGWIVTYEELQDNKYPIVAARRSQANAFSVQQTIEQIAVVPYNDGFTGSFFTTADGKSLFNTAHVSPIGPTFSNMLSPSADLSEASLEDISIQIMGATNSRGGLIALQPRSLHVSRNEWYNANRIMKSVLQSNTSGNNINVLKATNAFPGGIHVNQFFASAHAWFVRTNAPTGMKFFWREKPNMKQDNDFDTKNAKALCYFRCSVTTGDVRSVYGSNGP